MIIVAVDGALVHQHVKALSQKSALEHAIIPLRHVGERAVLVMIVRLKHRTAVDVVLVNRAVEDFVIGFMQKFVMEGLEELSIVQLEQQTPGVE